ncbi:MAG TPA: hypothetical protein VI759_06435 [Dehalococcoidia bacterium]|nr:hypothetical protein [Dehalococcoidia bacterium]
MQSNTATFRRTRRRLRVIGRELADVVSAGALLQGGFATVSLIHTPEPIARAAVADPDAVTLVLLDAACSEDEIRAALAQDGGLILVATPDAGSHEAASESVFPSLQAVLLQATVASFSAQLANRVEVTIA